MAEGEPIPDAAHSPSNSASASTSSSCVNLKSPPLKTGFTNGLITGFNQESSSENIQTSINTDQNNGNEQSSIVPTTTRSPTDTEIDTVQNEVYSSPTPAQGEMSVTSSTQLLAAPNSGTIIMRQILKSIFYGGSAGLIESLVIVTSASSTQVTTGKIVALSLSMLILAAFIRLYKISKLWMNEQQNGSDGQNDVNVDQYEKVFGDRENYRLHFTMAMLSYVLFGLVPPLVYGFTFCKSEDKNFKIQTVTIATVLCTALLGTIEAYIERQNDGCPGCIYTIGNCIRKCIVDAIGPSFFTNVGGGIIEREDWRTKVRKVSKAYLKLCNDGHMKNQDKTFLYDFAKIMSESDVSMPKKVKENEMLNPLPESSREQQQDIAVTITPSEMTETIRHGNEAKSWKIIECVVVGGLYESITSLVIVTSAVTSNIISNGNILALALANLISGFFLIGHDLSITLKEQKRLKQRNEILRAALYYISHFTVAILSFTLFGAAPPLVYAFTIGDKNLKLTITAGVSLPYIALLAAFKAHLQKQRNQALISYIKTLASFMLLGVAAFVLSYLAGSLFGKLIEKVDWFH